MLKLNTFEKQIKKEEALFFSLCCQEDKLKLIKQIPMSFNDFLRITTILMILEFPFYAVQLYIFSRIM